MNLLGNPAPTFDDPLEMLVACHGRIQAQFSTLQKLQQHLFSHGNNADAQLAAQAILRYFETAGPNHHQDEEQDLFPRLLAAEQKNSADGRLKATDASQLITRLLADHTVMANAWQAIRPQLSAVAAGQQRQLDANIAEHFMGVYNAHIALENSQLIALAEQLLTTQELLKIGQQMASRRGVVYRQP